MGKKLFIFNFENTLLNTRAINPYLTNQNGISYLLNNLNLAPTTQIGNMKQVLENIGTLETCLIKSRFTQNDTNTLLQKHGLKSDLQIFENLSEIRYPKEDTILVTDSSTEVLEAQKYGITTLGVGFGEHTQSQLLRAGASVVSSEQEEIFNLLQKFKQEEFGFKQREIKKDLKIITNTQSLNPEILISSTQEYIPYHKDRQSFYATNSDHILSFKRMKNFTIDQINNGASDDYYYNGIKTGNQFANTWHELFNKLTSHIQSLNLTGKTIICGVPNSLPNFCYRTDINELTSNELNEKLSNQKLEQRLLERFNPILSAHSTGNRNQQQQYQTIAYRETEFNPETKNIILFDDITTTGNQLITTGNIIRQGLEFNGNLFGLTLGRTN